jgi:hypothetical protein
MNAPLSPVRILTTKGMIRVVKKHYARRPSPKRLLGGLECPADEDLAGYIEGCLDAFASMRVHEHLSYCPYCYATYVETLDYLERKTPIDELLVS